MVDVAAIVPDAAAVGRVLRVRELATVPAVAVKVLLAEVTLMAFHAIGGTMLLLMDLHVGVGEPDGEAPTDPDDPGSVDDGDALELGEAEEMPGEREDMEGGVGEVDEVSEGDELEGRGGPEEHDDPVEN